MKRLLSISVLTSAALALSAGVAPGQTDYLWVAAPPGPANWNVADNWNLMLVPSHPLGGFEVAVITNGGRAFIDANAPDGTDPVAGLILGREAGESGFLEIRGGGVLGVVQEIDQGGMATIGQLGRGVVDVLPGGTFDTLALTVGGDADSQLNMSGDASVFVEGSANLGRHTRVTGPDVIFNAEILVLRGTLIAEITGPSHSPLTVNETATLRGGLQVEFNGHDPQFGDIWSLVEADRLFGEFAQIDTSAAPVLPEGLQYRVVSNFTAGMVDLTVGNSLVLTVNRANGQASMSNVIGGPIEFDGYSILSDGGLLSGAWNSFAASGVAGPDWFTANPSDTALSELNLMGAFSLGVGESLSIGNPYALGTPPEDDDLVFQYTSGGSVLDGIVRYIDMPSVLGDTDGDGDVDIDDLNNVRNNFGAMGLGDTDSDGDVDIDDLNNVRNNFGAMAAVPEPGALSLVLCAIAVGAMHRPRRAAVLSP